MLRFSVPLLCLALASLAQTDPKEPVYKFYSTVFGTTVFKPGGLSGYVYAIEPGTQQLPHLERKNAIARIYTTALDVPAQNYDVGFPGVDGRFEWFAIDYTGNIWISKKGKYRFTLSSDDGSVLFVDDHLVIDNDGIHPPQVKKGSVSLREGSHGIRIVYFQGPRFQVQLQLRVAGPGEKLHIFDTGEFAPPHN